MDIKIELANHSCQREPTENCYTNLEALRRELDSVWEVASQEVLSQAISKKTSNFTIKFKISPKTAQTLPDLKSIQSSKEAERHLLNSVTNLPMPANPTTPNLKNVERYKRLTSKSNHPFIFRNPLSFGTSFSRLFLYPLLPLRHS